MTIRHLQIFRAVCENESVTKAAERLGMSQPAVSIAIRELESYYNTKLFDRVGRRIRLTDEGRALLRSAESIIGEFEDAERLLRDGGSFRKCRIGVNVSVGETLLCGILDRLEREVETIEPVVFVGNTRTVERKLDDGELDFIVADCVSHTAERVVVPYMDGEACVVCSPEYDVPDELEFARLAAYPLLLREPGSGSRAVVEAIAGERGVVIEPTVESTSDLCLLRLAERGQGITILPRELIRQSIDDGRLRELALTDAQMMRRYSLAYIKRRHHTATVTAAIECLVRVGGRSAES